MGGGTASTWGKRIGVLTPATNLTVETELWNMAVPGTTIATARIMIDKVQWQHEDDLRLFVEGVKRRVPETTEFLVEMEPDVLLLGIASSPLWDGLEGNAEIKAQVKQSTGLDMVTPVDAVQQALSAFGAKRIGVVTPYPELADAKVVSFFGELGVEVLCQKGLRCRSAQEIGDVPGHVLWDAFAEVCVDGVDAVAQLGTDLKTAAVAAEAERWLGKPVLAINAVTWWCALRHLGLPTQLRGWGSLLEFH